MTEQEEQQQEEKGKKEKEEEDTDIFNLPLTRPVPKLRYSEGDAKLCASCDALTLYVTGCIICRYQESKD